MATTSERRRTAGDVVLGVLLLLAGLFVLGNAVLATKASIVLLGWIAVCAGLALFLGAFFRIGSGRFWSAALGGALLVVLGVFTLRNPAIGAATLTLLAGSLFLAGGLVRIVFAFQMSEARWLLLVSGIISVLLGLYVLFNLGTASLALLGVLIGIQILVEGLTMLVAGRVRSAPATGMRLGAAT
jgi:uncharacterized membrane protein HdeD (DUF308 family)